MLSLVSNLNQTDYRVGGEISIFTHSERKAANVEEAQLEKHTWAVSYCTSLLCLNVCACMNEGGNQESTFKLAALWENT